jgi:hypothetical protein
MVLKVIRGDLFSDFLGTNNNTVGVVSMIPQSQKKKKSFYQVHVHFRLMA